MKKFKAVLINALPFIVLSISLLVYGIIRNHGVLTVEKIVDVFLTGLLAGFLEELIFRKLLQGFLIKKLGDKKYFIGIIIAALIFGLVHLTNLFQGGSFYSTIEQVIGASLMGVIFGLIYYHSKSYLLAAGLHAFYDICAGICNGGQMLETEQSFNFLGSSIYSIFLILIIVNFFIKDKKIRKLLIPIEVLMIIAVILFD